MDRHETGGMSLWDRTDALVPHELSVIAHARVGRPYHPAHD